MHTNALLQRTSAFRHEELVRGYRASSFLSMFLMSFPGCCLSLIRENLGFGGNRGFRLPAVRRSYTEAHRVATRPSFPMYAVKHG